MAYLHKVVIFAVLVCATSASSNLEKIKEMARTLGKLDKRIQGTERYLSL